MINEIRFILIDDSASVIDRIYDWGQVATGVGFDFSVSLCSNKEDALSLIKSGNFSGIITDFYLNDDCSSNSHDIIRFALINNMEVIVYSSIKRLQKHADLFKNKNIEFYVREDDESFYLAMAIRLIEKTLLKRVTKLIHSEFYIFDEKKAKAIANILISGDLGVDRPLILIGPQGSRRGHIAKKMVEFLKGDLTVSSPGHPGNLSTKKNNRFLVAKDYDKMPEYHQKKINRAILDGVFCFVIYTCSSLENMNIEKAYIIKLSPFYSRKNEISTISKQILGFNPSSEFIKYVVNKRLSISDITKIKTFMQDDRTVDLIKIHKNIEDVGSVFKKQKKKKKEDKHNKIKDEINRGIPVSILAKRYKMTQENVRKIRREMVA